MKRIFSFVVSAFTVTVLASATQAQGGIGEPARPKMQSENLSPMKITPPVVVGAVEDISVTLPETDGFARDAALTEAARKGLPQALAQFENPVTEVEAQAIAKSVGEPMQFVKSYKIVKELLVPSYSLTVDMIYDVAKLQANFGKKETTTTTSSAATTVSGSWSTTGPGPALTGTPVRVQVEATGAANQDKVYNNLARAGLKPVWKVINRDGGALVLNNTGTLEELREKIDGLGFDANVVGDGLTIRLE